MKPVGLTSDHWLIHQRLGYMCDWLCERGLITDPNGTYLETHNLTHKFGTTLKLGPNILLTYLTIVWCNVKVIV